jgi:lipoprotein-anchoring transpeptidase ErfK/SrfK
MAPKLPSLEIKISKKDRKLRLEHITQSNEILIMAADVVSGCEESATPSGAYKAGKWIKDKTNPTHGPSPWSQDPWHNPYGPYFLPLNSPRTGQYTTYGIHGTRGPYFGNFEKPPVPEEIVRLFVGEEQAKYLYCSHGCVRLSNRNIERLYSVTMEPRFSGIQIDVAIGK